VITGCMFAGKSEEAIKRITKEQYSRERHVVVFIPQKARRRVTMSNAEEIDTAGKVVSRSGKVIECVEFDETTPWEIVRKLSPGVTTVVIEEAHFCDNELVKVCKHLAEKCKIRVIVIGLDQTFDEEPFGPMPALMAEAEYVTKELATCTECGSQNASKSWLDSRALDNVQEGKILVGDKQYRAVCRHCYGRLADKYPKKN
ncbi:MAG: hypothetical protein AAB575_02750, partial [Patescibacteria group bacterium]